MRNFVIVGYSCSGKSTLGRVLSAEFGHSIVEVGAKVVEESMDCKLCDNPLNHADHVFKSGDVCRFIKKALNDSVSLRLPLAIVGPRRPEEIIYCERKNLFPYIVGLEVPFKIRVERFKKRGSFKYNDKCNQILMNRDNVEASWGLDHLLQSADLILNGSLPLEFLKVDIINGVKGAMGHESIRWKKIS